MVPLEYYLILSGIIFTIGVAGVVISRNIIIVFMAIELMLNAANLALISFARQFADSGGHVFVFIVMAVAAAEAAVGLAIIISLFRNKDTINIDEFNIMKW